eukprot:s990_g5.t1
MGSLKSLTVQPKTRQRYAEELQHFFAYLRREGLSLPKQRDQMDPLVSDYLEFLWSQGEGRAMASTFLASLQDSDPKLKGCLPGSWRLMKTWVSNEVPHRAPPLSESVLRAMVGWSIMHDEPLFGLSLLVAFHGLLRSGELLGLQAWQIHMTGRTTPAVISLGLTKSGKRQGAAESVTITEQSVLLALWKWKQNEPKQAQSPERSPDEEQVSSASEAAEVEEEAPQVKAEKKAKDAKDAKGKAAEASSKAPVPGVVKKILEKSAESGEGKEAELELKKEVDRLQEELTNRANNLKEEKNKQKTLRKEIKDLRKEFHNLAVPWLNCCPDLTRPIGRHEDNSRNSKMVKDSRVT